jgi:hypothetical protein
VFIVTLLERAFDARHEAGGFVPGVAWVFQHRDIHHVWAMTICVGGALLMFNVQAVLQRHLGEGTLSRLFLAIPLAEVEAKRIKTDAARGPRSNSAR